MPAGHMLRYHLLVPTAVFIVLLAVGVSFGSAIALGMMCGCMSMMAMLIGGMKSRDDGHRHRSACRLGTS